MPIYIELDKILHQRDMTARELARAIDITDANLSILKKGHAKAIRFSTLDKICRVLNCSPGELIKHVNSIEET
ncbi:helix-turn-helix domain-containing protein [Pantoea agglomerans]|uniref:helix-turn-helix domain-containing protein n=1 Tax=Enterobacter agglomerans TaxID=549 RepID=UPI0013BD10CB|nr:helix-turn-helix transcriptional regulator [Pantoea agglomerans]NEG59745.1 helix-turn-helix domain-containing protein [Pantoea agglomerans]NEH00808.1 helix-turn-helix domain-containing protein [Pantoea agglomerans]NEH05155.1 helix-turn-helix domain-containing protein [Pantoea agglomerans]NEH16314.1 helix-turn-helix domain-containing protein [Pantoea agglomerans]